MDVKCPHCHQKIELVTGSELTQFGLSANAVQHQRGKERFPEPYLRFPNRMVYLRSDVEEWVKTRSQRVVETRVKELMQALANLSDEERAEARKSLEAILGK